MVAVTFSIKQDLSSTKLDLISLNDVNLHEDMNTLKGKLAEAKKIDTQNLSKCL